MVNIGTILDLKEDGAIVMTKKCNFVKIKIRPGMVPGEEVTFDISDLQSPVIRPSKNTSVIRLTAALVSSVAALLVFLFIGMQFFTARSEYAYIDVDINPSLSFVIDSRDVVIDVKPVNEDAKLVISDLEFKNKPLNDVVCKVIDNAKNCGLIKSNNSTNVILISASINNESKEYKSGKEQEEGKLEAYLNSLCRIVDTYEGVNISARIVKVNPELRKEALKNNVSMGRYYLYDEANKKGMNVSLDDMKNDSVGDMLEKLQTVIEPLSNIKTGDNTSKPVETQITTPAPTTEAVAGVPMQTSTKAPGQSFNQENTALPYTHNPQNISSTDYTPFAAYTEIPIGTPNAVNTDSVVFTPNLECTVKPVITPVPQPTYKEKNRPQLCRIVNMNSNKPVVVENSLLSNGAKILQGTGKGNGNTDWVLEDLGDGYYKIVSSLSQKAVTVERGLLKNNAKLIQNDYTGSEIEQWQLIDLGDGSFEIVNRLSGKCWEVEGAGTGIGACIVQNTFSDKNSQKWKLVKVD